MVDVRRFRKQVEVMLRTMAPRETGEKGVAGGVGPYGDGLELETSV